MRIGYPCLNYTVGCRASAPFREASYSADRLCACIASNLDCLQQILSFNREHGLLFFRISSDLIPSASHPASTLDWRDAFAGRFSDIGRTIRENGMRVGMHPDQFTIINALEADIVNNSIRELEYHAAVLDALGVDVTHKVQIHVGGIYGDKEASIQRFVQRFKELPDAVRRRLVIENDDRLFSLTDCLAIHAQTGVPVVFDTLHHTLNNDDTTCAEAFGRFDATWSKADGPPIVDYSTQDPQKKAGAHAPTIDTSHFREFLKRTQGYDFDIMCEIKDKEASAIKAARIAASLGRL